MKWPFLISIALSIGVGILITVSFNNIWIGASIAIILQLGLTAYGASYIRSGFFIKSTNVIQAGQMRLVLSFDDGPDRYTDGIMQVLDKHGVKAVFFVIGEKVVGNEEQVRKLNSHGHLVGNHTTSHKGSFYFWSSKKMLADIEHNNTQLSKIIGKAITYFRPPFGVTNPSLARAIKKTGMITVGWSIRTLDTVRKPDEKMEKKILGKVKDGDIILFHDTTNGLIELLDSLIPRLKEKGFNFVIL
jgi:peptidoglycan-N-acetylglucosamine deacetylase